MQKETRINLNTQFGNYMKNWNVDVIDKLYTSLK